MGTNYYWYPARLDPCAHCGRSDSPNQPMLHIGKSSAGWVFGLRVHREEEIDGLEAWKAVWSRPGSTIENEYGEVVAPDAMLAIITDRRHTQRGDDGYAWTPEEIRRAKQNQALPGPRGLWKSDPATGWGGSERRRVTDPDDGGTYELLDFEFS